MKMLYILLLCVVLCGCATTHKAPTPFTTTPQTVTLQGCTDLHEEVKEKNKSLPADKQLKADC